ncbi:FtsK/SpoIIIE domain-containing protein [Phycisphaera mikurensis]|uniref:FtsK/SpoIIIE domain-containing protein n=1 Tax=Phycisphaera mikurensis TaxID=547188 RepID=UPI0012B523A9|nr:FtsK/SpoIIIE domain-containing protein [Phycisphaera mikurensis]MBB6440344.1 hypothetical protein [Phycisphaera mikurensis]
MNSPSRPLRSAGALLAELKEVVAAAARAWAEAEADGQRETAAVAARHRETSQRAQRRAKRARAAAAGHAETAAAAAEAAATEDEAGLRARAARARRRLQEQTDRRVSVLERELEHERWVAGSVYEGTSTDLKRQKAAAERAAAERQARRVAEKAATEQELKRLRFASVGRLAGSGGHEAEASADEDADTNTDADAADPWSATDAALARAEATRIRLQKLVLPELFVGPGPWLAAAGLAAVGAVGGAIATAERGDRLPGFLSGFAAAQGLSADLAAQALGAVLGGLLALMAAVAAGWPLRRAARRRVEVLAGEAAAARSASAAALSAGGRAVLERLKRKAREARAARDAAFAETQEKHGPQIERLKAANLERLGRLADAVRVRKQGVGSSAGRRQANAAAAAEAAAAGLAAREQKRQRVTDARRDRDAARAAGSADRRRIAVREDAVRGLHAVTAELDRLRDAADAACPPWEDGAWSGWSPPAACAGPVRLGTHEVDRAELLGGIDWPAGLPPLPERLAVPAVLGPVGSGEPRSLRVAAPAAERERAVGILRAAVLRWLTTQPPGRVRLTLLDPVGLGESFAALMHLADADPRLVGGRIWSEPRDLDAQLAELTEHVAVVIQDRLRNEHDDVEAFNAHAGPLAEPYRLLVVADYPHGFSPEAAARLENLAASGPRCGVFLALSRDTDEPLPAGCEGLPPSAVRDLELAQTPAYDGRAVEPEPAPSAARATSLVRAVGEAAKRADRVAVGFAEVAPAESERWTADATDRIEVPMGRSGAARLERFRLGEGVAQHALIAGKTGSGKSSLLHVLATNLCLCYPPEEVELYLIDFKKGVEFKPYGLHRLPHARAVAVESDRAFGLAILRKLDEQMDERGRLFRDAGVAGLAGYRAKSSESGGARMPRTLLIVDEFQELFAREDRIAQDAAALLDRLVRQGRAFGMHAVLGSQSLSGAAQLARGTLGQMAVRIALACNEADSQLILGDDNPAAGTLVRPGEAIHNDRGGEVEANRRFQVAWLPEGEQAEVLAGIRELAESRAGGKPAPGPVVFEGGAAADLGDNAELRRLREASPPDAGPAEPVFWVGEPIALSGPVAVRLERVRNGHIAAAGGGEGDRRDLLLNAAACLAPQFPPSAPADGLPPLWAVLGGGVDGLDERVRAAGPSGTRAVGGARAADALAAFHAELLRREAEGDAEEAAAVLALFGVERIRGLEPEEEAFALPSFDDEPGEAEAAEAVAPGAALADLVERGAACGLHLLLLADGADALESAVGRAGLRAFNTRVLFQMSSNDSAALTDATDAAGLGPLRGLVFREDRGTAVPFRPYRASATPLPASV